MADLMQPPDLTIFNAFTHGDEHALLGLYRTQYDALLQRARDALGPELSHYCGRVAQQAMLVTWQHHDAYETSPALTAAIETAIRNEADVYRRKHAALQKGSKASNTASHVVPLGADAAVDALLTQLHATPIDHAQAQLDALAARKQHAAEHVQEVARTGGWVIPALLIAVLGVGIIVAMRWVGANGTEASATQALRADNARNINSARGQRGNVTLGDGSTARVGSDSHLKVPAEFGGAVRTLELNGTAMFIVAPGKANDFVVRARNVIITATGTQFTVRAFEEDSAVIVSVDEGRVSVRASDQRASTTIDAGNALRMTHDGTSTPLDEATRAVALAWVHDTLVFTDAPVKVVLPELIRWFDLKASLANAALGERRVTLRVGLQSSGDALTALAAAAKLSIGFDKDDRVLLGDAAVATPVSPAPKRRGSKKP